MIRKLLPFTAGYRKWLFLAALCAASEAVFEMLLPLVMADIVDVGIPAGDISFIMKNGVLMPITAILTCIVVCYVIKPKAIIDEVALTGKFKLEKLFRRMIYIAPVLLLVILVFAIFEAFGITFGGFLKF